MADKRLGLLINFNAALIEDGIIRVANGLKERSLAEAQRPQRKTERRSLHWRFSH
jgi:hypothetical protein